MSRGYSWLVRRLLGTATCATPRRATSSSAASALLPRAGRDPRPRAGSGTPSSWCAAARRGPAHGRDPGRVRAPVRQDVDRARPARLRPLLRQLLSFRRAPANEAAVEGAGGDRPPARRRGSGCCTAGHGSLPAGPLAAPAQRLAAAARRRASVAGDPPRRALLQSLSPRAGAGCASATTASSATNACSIWRRSIALEDAGHARGAGGGPHPHQRRLSRPPAAGALSRPWPRR